MVYLNLKPRMADLNLKPRNRLLWCGIVWVLIHVSVGYDLKRIAILCSVFSERYRTKYVSSQTLGPGVKGQTLNPKP